MTGSTQQSRSGPNYCEDLPLDQHGHFEGSGGRLAELGRQVTGSRLIVDRDIMEQYRRDETVAVAPGSPMAVLLAEDTNAVSEALAWANRYRVPVVARGAGTSLAGGATALDGCLVISTTRMRRIRQIDVQNRLVDVEAGVITADVSKAATDAGLFYPPDPSSYEISTIGGNLATNAGGLRCVKYGVTRDFALGLEVVLADGRVLQTGRRTIKGVAGYDLTSLFVGSEGTLGIITGATLRLKLPPPSRPITVVGAFRHLAEAGLAASRVVAQGLEPSLLELMDRQTVRAINDWKQMDLDVEAAALLVAQVDNAHAEESATGIANVFREAGGTFVGRSNSDDEAEQLLAVRRLAYPAVERLGNCLVEDVAVPCSELARMLKAVEDVGERYGVRIATVAHAGDGNIHPTFVYDHGLSTVPPEVMAAADEIFRFALELGGTITGEHGVGMLKRQWVQSELGGISIAVHHDIKRALDPQGILNPGRGF